MTNYDLLKEIENLWGKLFINYEKMAVDDIISFLNSKHYKYLKDDDVEIINLLEKERGYKVYKSIQEAIHDIEMSGYEVTSKEPICTYCKSKLIVTDKHTRCPYCFDFIEKDK